MPENVTPAVTAHSPHMPAPTLWPAAVALGVAFVFWGLISSLIISGIGLALFVLGIIKWIADIRHERNT